VVSEARVAPYARPRVALVAESVGRAAVTGPIGKYELALQQRGVYRAVRSVGARPACPGPLIVVVAIGAGNYAGCSVGADEARNVGISPRRRYGVIGERGRTRFEARVGLNELTFYPGSSLDRAVGVAPETELVLQAHLGDTRAGARDPPDSLERSRGIGGRRVDRARGVGVVTVDALHVTDRVYQVLGGEVNIVKGHRMDALFREFVLYVYLPRRAVMAREAVFLRFYVILERRRVGTVCIDDAPVPVAAGPRRPGPGARHARYPVNGIGAHPIPVDLVSRFDRRRPQDVPV